MRDVFQKIYDENLWQSEESVSGTGSTMEQTAEVRRFLPHLLEAFDVRTLLDIPCGDLNWISKIDLGIEQYIGADIVPQLIAGNRTKYPNEDIFKVLDITTDDLPQVDMVLVRDLLGHFSRADVRLALKNLKRSRSRYLLTTTFPSEKTEGDIKTGQWHPINLASMYGMPDPIAFWPEINVKFKDGHESIKGLGLWDLRG